MTFADLIARWETEAATLEGYGAVQAATAARRHAAELRAALDARADELLDLSQAAHESGYSRRRIRELIAEGTVPNAGRKGAPRIRRADLPRKPGGAGDGGGGFDADAEVARLLETR